MQLSIIVVVSLAFNIICKKYSDGAVGKAFSLVVPAGNGGGSCATEVPFKEEFASNFIQCGVLCTAEPACIYFSYTEETQRCLTFNSSSMTFAAVDSCNTYRILILEISPKDVLTFVGSRVTLECRRSSQLVQWTHAEGSNATSKVIVEQCQVVDEFADLYAVDKSDLSCNVIINNVTINHGGLYSCQDQLSTEPPSTAEVFVCPDGFKSVVGSKSCYKTIFKAVNWTTAGQLCESLVNGSYSAMITSANETNAVAAYLDQQISDSASNVCPSSGDGKFFWTSGQRLTDCSSSFYWKPNLKTIIPFAYLNWAVNQPDCTGGTDFCVHVWPNNAYRWNDISCVENMCVLCEYGPF